MRYSEISKNNSENIFQETGKMFNNESQRKEFISFLEYIHSKKLALISKDLFNIFEQHGVPVGEKRSQVE